MRSWLATFVRRWHNNPALAETVDPIGGHSARMAILALQFDPACSRELLVACLIHDLGEIGVGDMSGPVKRNNPILKAALDAAEAAELFVNQDLQMPTLSPEDQHKLKLFDKLDGYLWVQKHAPDQLKRKDWELVLARLQAAAMKVGYHRNLDILIKEGSKQ